MVLGQSGYFMNGSSLLSWASLSVQRFATDHGELAVLAAVPLGTDGRMARLYLGILPPDVTLLDEGSGGLVWVRVVDGAAIADVLRNPDGTAPLPVADIKAQVIVADDQTGLFDGRDVLLGHANGETAEHLRHWLDWHHRHHGMTGALVFVQGPQGAAQAMARDLLASDLPLPDCPVHLVDVDLPLGDAALGHETHPINAPAAPGKDRMDPPPPDPWHAPLGYPLLCDLLRATYLARARAVANIAVMDLISPVPDSTVFAVARAAPMGLVALRGEEVYPWTLRKSDVPGFGDHICKRFDAAGWHWRWALSQDNLPDGTIWMQTRLLGAKTATAPLPFLRHMALRHGRAADVAISQIVPRTSLVEDAQLLAQAQALGVTPDRPPAAPVPVKPTGNRVTIVTTMKNEGPFILEWLAYHRAIGIKDFLIYTNDCSDGTDHFLQLLAAKGLCEWRENPYRATGMKPQHAALDAANDEELVTSADWAICMDVDEYIAVHTGDGTMAALFDALGDANMVSLTWRLFGNNDIDLYQDTFITQQFTRCARAFANKPHQAWGFKTLYRNIGLFRKMGVHRPKGLQPGAVDQIKWVNGSGQPMPRSEWRNAWRSHSGTFGYDLVSLNHYAVRSAESFLVKRDRGRVNHVDRDQGLAYWFRMNHNVVVDDRMMRMQPALQAEFDRLMADPEIAAAHHASVAAHRAKIAELRAQPKYAAFHAELISPRLQKLSRLHGHFGANVYLVGPHVISDDIVAKEPEDSFFFTVDHVGETQH
jgi:hypothetical protein